MTSLHSNAPRSIGADTHTIGADMTTKTQSGIYGGKIVNDVLAEQIEEIRLACVEHDLPFSPRQIRAAARKRLPEALKLRAAIEYGNQLRATLPKYMNVEDWVMPARVKFLDGASIIEHPALGRGRPLRYRLVIK